MKKNLYRTSEKIGKEKNFETSWGVYDEVLKVIKIRNNEKILAAGCGYGISGNYVMKQNIYGFKIDKEALKKARKNNYKKLVISEIYKLPFKDKYFDKSVSIQVFQYIEEPEKALNELIRVTKEKIVLSAPNFKWLQLSSYLSNKYKERFIYCRENENFTDERFMRNLGKKFNLDVKVYYASNKFSFFRNIFGKYISSEIIAIYNLKEK